MDYVPYRNCNYDYDCREDGTVTIHVKWTGIYHKIASALFHKPSVSHIDLDEMGSFLWCAMDGVKTVYDLLLEFQERFPGEPNAAGRVSEFLNILHNNQFIEYHTPVPKN